MAGNKRANRKNKRVVARLQPPLQFRPMPNMRVSLLFRQEKLFSESAAGVGANNWYRINGAFDPDQSVGGPSALGFSNYATLYTSYRVLAMRIRVEGTIGASVGGNHFACVTLMPNPRQVTAPSDPALWGGEYLSESKTLVYTSNGGKNTFTLDKTFYPWEVLRITKDQYMTEADYSSLVTTTPVKECYVALGVNGIQSAATITLLAMVTISYEVEFFEPALLS
jgi:hypothetical protein